MSISVKTRIRSYSVQDIKAVEDLIRARKENRPYDGPDAIRDYAYDVLETLLTIFQSPVIHISDSVSKDVLNVIQEAKHIELEASRCSLFNLYGSKNPSDTKEVPCGNISITI